ncbi:hypothetical protein RHMOL_Rhmol10G0152100 [Rhododendron molle]|uniref:Uncharacterized protein n=1 Tax=Rhododendron molle TaxID=49168 RepID=A0ACC0M2B6_RHOML|nr:hypothetical protein RHMOL_Rhmol10G0152100 [Rhododendron molle]
MDLKVRDLWNGDHWDFSRLSIDLPLEIMREITKISIQMHCHALTFPFGNTRLLGIATSSAKILSRWIATGITLSWQLKIGKCWWARGTKTGFLFGLQQV